jgi:hypothetical protein
MSRRGDGQGGNREVSPIPLRDDRVACSGAGGAAYSEEEGGSWERYASWDDTTEPKASEAPE